MQCREMFELVCSIFSIFMNMNVFFNMLASGTRSLSFERQCIFNDSEYPAYEPKFTLREPRQPKSPAEIMREAWEDVGNRMREAMGIVETE